MTNPKITLCVIARDEEMFLPGCLASVEGAVDEIVVVDTGSVDSTVALAREAGAIVVHHTWNDDFSAARNAAIPHATGDYILVLDADERLAPGAAEVIRSAVAERTLALGLLPLHNASRLDAKPEEILDGTSRIGQPVGLPRLVRKTEDLLWEGIVHEQLRNWLGRNANRGNVIHIDANIVHFGAVPEIREGKRKHERNLALLERMCVLEPHMPHGWFHLAAERLRAGNPDGAHEAVEHGWVAMVRASRKKGIRPLAVPIVSLRAKLALARGEFQIVLDTIEQARSWGEGHPNYGWYAGQASRALGDLARSEKEFRAALALRDKPMMAEIHEGVVSWASEYGLGSVLLLTGRAEEALACFDRGLAERPFQVELGVGRADALIALGRPAEALAALETYLPAETGDGWTLAAEAACMIGDFQNALTFAAHGANQKFIESSRLRRRNELHSRLSFHHGHPRTGEGPFGVLGALVSHALLPSTPAEVRDEHVQEAVDALVALGRSDAIEALLEPRAASVVPHLHAWVHASLERHGLIWTPDDEPDVVFVGGADAARAKEVADAIAVYPRLWRITGEQTSLQAAWRAVAGPPPEDLDADDAAARLWLIQQLKAGAPDGRRMVMCADLKDVEWIADRLLRARFVHVIPPATDTASLPQVIDLRGRASALTGRVHEVWSEEWLSTRMREVDKLLAFLGEAPREVASEAPTDSTASDAAARTPAA